MFHDPAPAPREYRGARRALWLGAALLSCASAGRAAQSSLGYTETVRLGLAGSRTLAAARIRRDASVAAARAGRPGFSPAIDLGAGQTLNTSPVELPGGAGRDVLPRQVSRLFLDFRQPLYRFGLGDAPMRRSEAMEEAAELAYREAVLAEARELGEAYWALRRAEGAVVAAARGAELAGENFRVTRLLVEAGRLAEVDRLEAERAQAEAKLNLLRVENGVTLARASLNRLLGRPLREPIATGADPPYDPPGEGDLLPEALASRPDVLRLQAAIRAAEAGVRLARAGRLPSLQLEAVYSVQTETALQPASGLSTSLVFRAPLFDTAVQRVERLQAEQGLAELRSALEALQSGVALELQAHRLALEEARSRIDLAGRAEALSMQILDITAARRDLGRATQAEMLAARLAVERALLDRANATADLFVAKLRLEASAGRLPAGSLERDRK